MNEKEAITQRHAVREYLDKPMEPEIVALIKAEICKCNEEAGLHLQLVTNSTGAFKSLIPAFGRFKGVQNYIALVGKDGDYEKCGYYGAKLAILAQMNGLNSCFVTTSYKASGCEVSLEPGEILMGLIALGYGKDCGKPHKSKPMESLCRPTDSEWMQKGMEAAMLAPTGLNRQNFYVEECDGGAKISPLNQKPMTLIDLGIVKYHFEVGADKDSSVWCEREITNEE